MKTHKSLMASCLSVLSITLLYSMHKLLLHSTQIVLGCWVIGTVNAPRYKHKVMIFFWIYRRICRYFRFKNTSTHGSAYTGQLALGTHFDLNKILGWQDTEAQITLTYRDGQSLSEHSPALAGHLSSVQEVWGVNKLGV